ncbi:hypothetical protein M670_04897 [Schinkia azotoformans MEV2011]|uniref:DUF4179 domain-containing protein n=1 Tax=Schinkia azotoformans MEV2011 TaxID=1348973 RepID=A0A072NE20_SCHAZ|nr:DUF4179 domain-containing protein [Schinkia azotoformans]KEF35924.1 hypothetical protein M670_04897 [Schinkia azotoformans MEV2011]MEC1697518.1 DUF4179 domain-containing protein [Schinkia azotoformans]MEC1714406.1 DUF4179 domain-containing protein [Schinkia azotoformans]MEC1723729.1 DUF4179 domain-containing protein [Schinkia azotoformans]MEC1743346.1 DUF4179 domain-containing protein [Schinkia azotoformans]
MGKFDMDEQHIHEMFSKITVDSSKLAEQVKTRLHEENTNILSKHRRRWARSTVAAIVMSVVFVISVTAAVFENFDWFIERFNPSFGKIIEPVEAYSEDKGIRMEVIGAQKYDNMAIVYLSLQDITGQNRLTEQTDFRDGFNVKMNRQTKGADEVLSSSVSWKQKMLYFDEDTNTIYYEFNITADPDSPLADPLELGSFLIYFDEKAYTDEPVSVTLTGIEEAETIPLEKAQIWGGSNMPDNPSPLTEALMLGHYADMPHGEKAQWVSNIGMIDGKLHVQIGKISNKEFGPSDVTLSLKDPDGNFISYDYSLVFLSDEENSLLDLEKNDYADGIYKYEEFVFPVSNEDLSKYTLYFTGSVFSGVEGNWKVAANLSDSHLNMRTWKNDISVEGHLFEYITLSPLGLQVIGTYKGENCMVNEMLLEVETVDGVIPLEGGGGSQKPDKHTFNSSWNTKAPLDITKVKAIIVNGTRIPVK